MSSEQPLAIRVSLLELQMERIVSDIESEKGTRMRANSEISVELKEIRDGQRKTDKIIWMMMGGLAVLNVALEFFHR